MEKHSIQQRLYYLDWLRVFAVILLVPYHTGMIFMTWDFPIKNDVTSTGITICNVFIENWHMPLLFLLSGASTWFALNKRSPRAYIRERFRRLFVPLIFGMLIVVPPQTFYERIQKSGFDGNYFDFYAHLFNGIYPEGNLTWNHLWFLLYLFIISLSVLPLIARWKAGSGKALIGSCFAWLTKGHRIFLLFIPLAVIQMTLKVAFPGPQNIVSDWARLLFMLCIFVYGVKLFQCPGFRESLERNLSIAFVIGLSIFVFFVTAPYLGCRFYGGYNLPNLFQLGVKSLATLCWLIALLGFAQRSLNFGNRFLVYANEAVLPFYILHQSVIIILGYYIVKTNYPLMVKYTVINILSFMLSVAVYEIFIRRISLVRVLFGMRLMKNA